MAYWRSAVIVQSMLFGLAWLTARGFDDAIFRTEGIDRRDLLYGAGALLACFGFRWLARRMHSPEEMRELEVYRRAPRTTAELVLFHVASVIAGVAEEAAYRGVAWTILTYSLGATWPAAVILSIAFALAHWNQGWKSGVTIVAIALVFHGLVFLTDTLVIAMAVHALYDIVAGNLIRRTALANDRAAATRSPPWGTRRTVP